MTTFHDDAVKFMQELLILLQEESSSSRKGTLVTQEAVDATLLRLLGVLIQPVITEGSEEIPSDDPTATNSSQTAPDSLLHNFLKIQRNTTAQDVATINKLLKAFKSRLNRYSKARAKIKLNRIQKLIQEPSKPIDPADLTKDTPENTRREVAKKLDELQAAGDIKGLIQQEISTNQAMASSIDRVVAKVPEQTGVFRSQLIDLLRANGKESFRGIENLNRFKDELTKESNRIENMDKLLFEGETTYTTGVKLSLLKVLDVLIFLTDRQQMKYDCSQCKFFQKGSPNACVFAGAGETSRTSAVTVKDDQGAEVAGRLTQPRNSCKDVWGLESNEYFTPSDSIVKSLERVLRR